jgi:hypothetical protein
MHTIWRLVSVSMLWGIGIAVMLVSISKFVAISIPVTPGVASIIVVSLLAGVVRGILARVSPLEAAMTADVQLGLKERLSSAVEILGEKHRSGMAELQLEDAANYARSLGPKAICPRVFPITAKVLPLAGLALMFLWWIPSRSAIPAEVRQTIEQAGAEIETAAEEVDKDLLSDEVAELASKVELTGRELQDKPMTKKEALKNLSNLAREIETLKMMGKIAEELGSDMTPEKKRMLNELLEKLADNLRDLQGMEELSQKILKVQQASLSMEALRELSAALERMDIGASDMKALQQMSEQVAKGKREIGRVSLAAARGIDSASAQQEEESSGLMGGGAPGKDRAKDAEETVDASRRPIPSGEGYDSELEGQLSEKGRTVPTEIQADIEKGESVVPYEDIYVKYREAADDAITRAKIPWIYKEHVKSYFDAIKPKGDR